VENLDIPKPLPQVTYSELEPSHKQNLWSAFNKSLEPLYDKGKLGIVLFQYLEYYEVMEIIL
jgi:hypothetical protein